MWYVSLARVSVLFIKVHDPGRTEWSCRCCIGPAFMKVLFILTFHRHLLLAMVLSYLAYFWAYKY